MRSQNASIKLLSVVCGALFLMTSVADADARSKRRRRRAKKIRVAPKPPVPAPPAVSPAKLAAGKLLRSGLLKLKGGQYYEAIADFKKGLRHYESPTFYYNMGLAYRELRKYVSALEAFEKYVQKAKTKSKTGQYFKLAQEWIKLLKGRIAIVQVSVNVAGARVTVGGIDAGQSPNLRPVRIQPESKRLYDIKVTKAGYETEMGKDQQMRLKEGRTVSVAVKLITAAEATKRRKEFQYVAAERRRIQERLLGEQKRARLARAKRKRKIRVAGWSLIGSGGLVAVVGAVVGIVCLVDTKYVEDAAKGAEYSDYAMRNDRAFLLSKIAWAGIGSGLALAAAGGILLWWNSRRTETAQPAPGKPKVSLQPAIGPGGASVTLKLRF